MKIHICTNKDFLLTHKSLFIKENVIKLDNHFFYDLPFINSFQELINQKQYLPYIEEIHLYIDATLISFVDMICIIDYLNINHYQKKLTLHYYDQNTFQFTLMKQLPYEIRKKCSQIRQYLCKENDNYDVELLKNYIPNLRMCLMMYNSIQFDKKKLLIILNECVNNSESIFDAICYFEKNYSNYGFSKEYLKKSFETIMEEKYDRSI